MTERSGVVSTPGRRRTAVLFRHRSPVSSGCCFDTRCVLGRQVLFRHLAAVSHEVLFRHLMACSVQPLFRRLDWRRAVGPTITEGGTPHSSWSQPTEEGWRLPKRFARYGQTGPDCCREA